MDLVWLQCINAGSSLVKKKKGAILVSDSGNWGSCTCVGKGVYGISIRSSSQFYYKPKTSLKKQSLKKKKVIVSVTFKIQCIQLPSNQNLFFEINSKATHTHTHPKERRNSMKRCGGILEGYF